MVAVKEVRSFLISIFFCNCEVKKNKCLFFVQGLVLKEVAFWQLDNQMPQMVASVGPFVLRGEYACAVQTSVIELKDKFLIS